MASGISRFLINDSSDRGEFAEQVADGGALGIAAAAMWVGHAVAADAHAMQRALQAADDGSDARRERVDAIDDVEASLQGCDALMIAFCRRLVEGDK